MLSKEERQKIKVPPVVYLCYQYVLPLSSQRIVASDGHDFVLISIEKDDIHELCSYEIMQIPKIYQEDKNAKYEGLQKEEFDEQIRWFASEDYTPDCDVEFVEGYLIVGNQGLYGVIDYDGNTVIEPKYRHLQFWNGQEGKIEVQIS